MYLGVSTVPSVVLVSAQIINSGECLDTGLMQYILAQTAIFAIKLKNAFTSIPSIYPVLV